MSDSPSLQSADHTSDEVAFTALIASAQHGDAAAFGKLYQTIYPSLYHVSYCALRSAEDAADAVSDAVLDAFHSINRLKHPEAFRSWMFKILTAKIKRKQREYLHVAVELTDANTPAVEFGFLRPELSEALAKLSDEDRLLLSLQVLGGYSGKELARIFGSTDGAVRTRLLRIRQKLREWLTDTSVTEQRSEPYAL
ncbi:MAG: sigma-70 family RNA polymerase sigma factor [Oscillospiraceae bacterium]|nr:sigma-70 family RNA polymerase sigma factor [Oscillospiraceae bacterium]